MEEQMQREKRAREEKERQAIIAELKTLQGRKYSEEMVKNMTAMELTMYLMNARDMAKKARDERVQKDSERQLFLARAMRECALPDMKAFFEKSHADEVAYWEHSFETLYEQKKAQNERLAVLKPVCDRLKDHVEAYATRVLTRRVEAVKDVVEARFAEDEKKRKEEEERRRKEEEERKRVEEERRRKEEERKRAEEERRRKEEEELRRVEEARKEEERRREEERRKVIMADDDEKPEEKKPRARRAAPGRKAPAAAPAPAPAPAPVEEKAPEPAKPANEEEEWTTVERKKKGRRAPPRK